MNLRYLLLVLTALVLFQVNAGHRAEQTIFEKYHAHVETIGTYPLWGYGWFVWLVGGRVFPFQLLLAVGVSVLILHKRKTLVCLVWLVPMLTVASVRWPEAVYVPCLVLFQQTGWSWLGAGLSNLRPEFLPVSLLFPRLALFALVGLVPWMLHAGGLTSTNGGMVLAQWRGGGDESVGDAEWALTVEGNRTLVRRAVLDIASHPREYAKRVFGNMCKLLTNGVYVGEFAERRWLSIPFAVLLPVVIVRGMYRGDRFTRCFVACSIFLACFVQYQPRHLNAAFVLAALKEKP